MPVPAEGYIYIMGRGHSGSTVVDALLGNGIGLVGVGELAVAMDRLDGLCGCGATVKKCEFWARVRSQFEVETGIPWSRAAQLVKGQAYVTRFPWTLWVAEEDPDIKRLRKVTAGVANAIAAVSGETRVVDSTKEVTRGLFLTRFSPETQIIHLLRSPLSVVASHISRIRSGVGFPFLRRRYYSRFLEPALVLLAAVNWMVGNGLAELVGRLAPSRVLRLRYEDLCDHPDRELERLESFLGCDLGPVRDAIRADQALPLGHKIAGNRMREADEFRFQPERGSGRRLPWYYHLLIRSVTWPMMVRYGYRVFGTQGSAG